MALRRAVLVLGLAALAAVCVSACDATGCDTNPDANPASDFRGGKRYDLAGGPVYETSPADGGHLNFSAGSQFRVYHQLGGRPITVQLWVSFSSSGTKDGNEAVPAGNMAEVLCINEEFILVRNNSCGEYWLRVVARDPAPPQSTSGLDNACP